MFRKSVSEISSALKKKLFCKNSAVLLALSIPSTAGRSGATFLCLTARPGCGKHICFTMYPVLRCLQRRSPPDRGQCKRSPRFRNVFLHNSLYISFETKSKQNSKIPSLHNFALSMRCVGVEGRGEDVPNSFFSQSICKTITNPKKVHLITASFQCQTRTTEFS